MPLLPAMPSLVGLACLSVLNVVHSWLIVVAVRMLLGAPVESHMVDPVVVVSSLVFLITYCNWVINHPSTSSVLPRHRQRIHRHRGVAFPHLFSVIPFACLHRQFVIATTDRDASTRLSWCPLSSIARIFSTQQGCCCVACSSLGNSIATPMEYGCIVIVSTSPFLVHRRLYYAIFVVPSIHTRFSSW
jgi:hypothetical protein